MNSTNFKSLFLFFTIILPCLGICIDYSPRLGEMLVFDWRNSLLYQTYPSISTGNETQKKSADDIFLTTSLSTSVLQFGLEIEATEAFTHRQHGTPDNLALTFKYLYWDDVAGDPFSLTTGLSLIQAFNPSLNDLSSFHHGKAGGEIFVSVGKETACMEEWVRRWYSTIALGLADKGSPWLRCNWGYDFKFNEENEWKFFCHSLFGLGGKQLHLDHFRGYGSIRHRSIELGLRYTYVFELFGKLNFQYSNRVFAKNFPSRAHLFLIEFVYDFGIDSFL